VVARDARPFAYQFYISGVALMCSVTIVVYRWSVASCKLGYCPGVLLLFAQLLLVLRFVQRMQFGNFSCLVPADQQGSGRGME